MRSILPAEKHIGVLLELIGPPSQEAQYDRMAAIVGATFLEYGLRKCIKSHLKPDPIDADYNYLFSQDDAPYRDFSSLNRLARALGIISVLDYEQLETIRHIRNVFAHGMDNSLSFDSPDIADAIDSLVKIDAGWFKSITSIFTDKDVMQSLIGRRGIFMMAVFSCYWDLLLYHPGDRILVSQLGATLRGP
jgi:hypothetical protein